ncbi:hypothetical protein DPMN_093988 [Dreissena polymorpha]|uniref:Uncharacterized protein n=1 Tax=Dreissena polymorpha TaxID=45954 RepID=A0A9D4R1E8_DREPO|nr:hypothetical protein DPMN_093988 [Dreissena polymorpha]
MIGKHWRSDKVCIKASSGYEWGSHKLVTRAPRLTSTSTIGEKLLRWLQMLPSRVTPTLAHHLSKLQWLSSHRPSGLLFLRG